MGVTLTPPPNRATPFFEQAEAGPQLPHSLMVQAGGQDQPQQPAPRLISQPWSGWFRNLFNLLRPGVTENVVISGTTLHFVNGIYVGHS